ncbi:MAG: TolC family protein, partial [Saprospiraceae bacterium]
GNAQFSYRLYNGKRMYIVKKRLELQEAQSDIGLRQEINLTTFDVINRYININRLIKQRNAILETISFFEERTKLSLSRFEIGTAGKNDYLQSQVDLNVQRFNELTLVNNILLAKTDLNRILARDPFMSFEVEDVEIPAALPSREEIKAAIDSINPEVAYIRYNQQILEQSAFEIKTQQKPSVFGNASTTFNRNDNTAGFNLFTQTYGPQVGLSFSLPIFTGPIVRQQLRANALQYKNQGLQIDNVKQSLFSLAATAYQNFANAKRQIELEIHNLEIIRENNSISMERFRRASITTVELRQAQLNLVESQNRIINAQYTLKQSEVQIRYIMGGLVN